MSPVRAESNCEVLRTSDNLLEAELAAKALVVRPTDKQTDKTKVKGRKSSINKIVAKPADEEDECNIDDDRDKNLDQ